MMRFCNKGKAVPAHDMKVYGGSRDIALFILNLGARCKRVIIFMAMLPPAPVKQPLTSIEQEAGWMLRCFQHFGEVKNLLSLLGIREFNPESSSLWPSPKIAYYTYIHPYIGVSQHSFVLVSIEYETSQSYTITIHQNNLQYIHNRQHKTHNKHRTYKSTQYKIQYK